MKNFNTTLKAIVTTFIAVSTLAACKLNVNNLSENPSNETESPLPETDPYFSSVVLLCNFDSSLQDLIGHLLVPAGGTVLLNSDYKFGSGSATLDGIDINPIRLPVSSDFLLDGDFTIEMWLKTSLSNPQAVILGSNFVEDGVNNQIQINQDGTDRIGMYNDDGWLSSTDTVILQPNQWYHVAFSRQADTLRIYLDGQQLGNAITGSVSSYNFSKGSIGSLTDYGGAMYNGQIDELRITKGVARYTTSSFSLQTSPLPLE